MMGNRLFVSYDSKSPDLYGHVGSIPTSGTKSVPNEITASETTQWSSYRDLTNRIYYFRNYNNFNLHKIDLQRLDFNKDKVRTIPMFADKEIVIDVTQRGK